MQNPGGPSLLLFRPNTFPLCIGYCTESFEGFQSDESSDHLRLLRPKAPEPTISSRVKATVLSHGEIGNEARIQQALYGCAAVHRHVCWF